MTQRTPTRYWNDSCAVAELTHAVERGATGATSNPSIVLEVLGKESEHWIPRIRELATDNPDWRCLTFFGEDDGYNMHRAGNNILFADGHVAPFKQFDPRYLTYSPHNFQNWDDVTPD